MTSLQPFLGIELPIIQAPMAGVQGSALAVAKIFLGQAAAAGSDLAKELLSLVDKAVAMEFDRLYWQTLVKATYITFLHAGARALVAFAAAAFALAPVLDIICPP